VLRGNLRGKFLGADESPTDGGAGIARWASRPDAGEDLVASPHGIPGLPEIGDERCSPVPKYDYWRQAV